MMHWPCTDSIQCLKPLLKLSYWLFPKLIGSSSLHSASCENVMAAELPAVVAHSKLEIL